MYFLAELEISEGLKIILGIIRTSSRKKAMARLVDLLKKEGLDPKRENEYVRINGNTIINLIQVRPIMSNSAAIELAKKFLKMKT